MSRRPFYKRFGGDRIMATRDLTLEERASLDDCLDLMYDRGRPIPDEPRFLSGIIGISPRKWGIIRESLIAAGKLVVRGDYLSNPRFERELGLDAEAHQQRVEWGSKGGKTRAQRDKAAREAAAKAAQPGLPLVDGIVKTGDKSDPAPPAEKPAKEDESLDLERAFEEFSAGFQGENSREPEEKCKEINGSGQDPLKLARASHIPESREIEDSPLSRRPPSKPAAAKPSQGKAKSAKALPKNWTPDLLPEGMVDGMTSLWPPGMIDRELDRFKDHAAQNGRTAKDWNAAWRNWLRKADDDWKRAGARPGGKPSGWNFA